MRTCKHIKANGEFCGSPALRGREYCYFHLTVLGRRLRTQKHIMKGECHYLQLPTLEDADSIQLGVMQVMDALLRDQIDTKIAGLLLYGLQIASSNLKQGAHFEQDKSASVVVGSYDSFEQDYDLADTDCGLRVDGEEEEAVVEGSDTAGVVGEVEHRADEKAAETDDATNSEQGQTSVAQAEKTDRDFSEARFVRQPEESQHTYPSKTGLGGAPAPIAQDGRAVPDPQRIRRDAGRQGFKVRLRPERDQVPEQPREVA